MLLRWPARANAAKSTWATFVSAQSTSLKVRVQRIDARDRERDAAHGRALDGPNSWNVGREGCPRREIRPGLAPRRLARSVWIAS